MTYSTQYRTFLDNKNSFFQNANEFYKGESVTKSVRHNAFNQSYNFIADHKKLIEDEFNHLFASLTSGKETYGEEFWLYCYYLSILLQTYHIGHGSTRFNEEEKRYGKLRRQIWNHYHQIESSSEPPPRKKTFIKALGEELGDDISEIASTPKRLSKIRQKVGLYNVWRLYWAFSRMMLTNTLLELKDGPVLAKLERFLGKHIDVDAIVAAFEAPGEIMRTLSVAFFGSRFLMNLSMVYKHTFMPSELEKTRLRSKRLSDELWERHPGFINDFVWTVINGLTNYNEIFHISAPVAGWIVAGFLFFDVCVLLWRRHLEEQKYLAKKAQYREELSFYQKKLKEPDLDEDERKRYLQHIALLHSQLTELEIGWQATDSAFWFNVSAALLLMVGFSAAMMFNAPALIIVSYAICVLAIGMYLSDGAYKQYKEKSLRLRQADIDNISNVQALQEYKAARNELIYTMIKNTVMPSLIIATFAVCWPAAIVLTALYLGYELWSSCSKRRNPSPDPNLPEIERREVDRLEHVEYEEVDERLQLGYI
ncbi:hypothetical protein [Legionella spiritensis]|uniref:hypothetical protein n=1 Tax=Legionella spiritensis TaxID=452 RepID=UPI000F6BDC6D|nr:hypothetical protein [Legionella spiritensis]VEG91584.1 coiled-coil protein [Legionella spiritensis]